MQLASLLVGHDASGSGNDGNTKAAVEKLADMIRDFPAEDIWEMERYAEFLEARRELPKKKKATTGPLGTELPENWRRA